MCAASGPDAGRGARFGGPRGSRAGIRPGSDETVMRLLSALLAVTIPLAAAEKWKIQFFHDEDKSVLNIADLQFPSATRGVAVGVIREGSREKPVAVVTSDGGANWQTAELQELPVSLFFVS